VKNKDCWFIYIWSVEASIVLTTPKFSTKLVKCRVGHSLISKMSDCTFFEQKMSDLGNYSFFTHFCSFAHFERAIAFLSLFLKERRAIALLVALLKREKKERLLIFSFAKSNKKSDRSFTLFKRANEQAIAQSLFWKERKWAMSEWAIAQPCNELNTLVFKTN